MNPVIKLLIGLACYMLGFFFAIYWGLSAWESSVVWLVFAIGGKMEAAGFRGVKP